MGQEETLIDISGRLFVTVGEAAKILLVDPRTVRRGIENGEIPATKLAGALRIPAAWVRQQAHIEEGTE